MIGSVLGAMARRRGAHADRLLHLTIRTNAGSCEHYYHFLLGYLLPFAAYLVRRRIADDRMILLRSCGPLDRMLRELALPGLLLCERFTHEDVKNIAAQAAWAETDEIGGLDFGHTRPDQIQYDVPAIRVGADFVRGRLSAAVAMAAAEIDAAWSGRPRILLIERGEADPFYQSALAEIKDSANRRRSIGNHAELAAALAAAHPGLRNLKLETATLAEQIAWFGLADILVAQHGAALSNIIWMRPEARVIEIAPDPASEARLFGCLAEASGLSYALLRQGADAFGPMRVRDLEAVIAPAAASFREPLPIPLP